MLLTNCIECKGKTSRILFSDIFASNVDQFKMRKPKAVAANRSALYIETAKDYGRRVLDGKEMCSPMEYETLGLMGTNCGLDDPDDVALLNTIANNLGVDTIEVGAMLGILMDAGEADFGDHQFMADALEDIYKGTERGRLLAQGAARVGEHYNSKRIPVIKKQGISAYDPRVIEVTGVSMMVTAQGADHTAGNVPSFDCKGKSTREIVEASLETQIMVAAQDSLGLCVFGRSVTTQQKAFIIDAINDAHGTNYDEAYQAAFKEWKQMG